MLEACRIATFGRLDWRTLSWMNFQDQFLVAIVAGWVNRGLEPGPLRPKVVGSSPTAPTTRPGEVVRDAGPYTP